MAKALWRTPANGWTADIEAALRAALESADPDRAVLRNCRREGKAFLLGEQRFEDEELGRVTAISIGKAAYAMAGAVQAFLGGRIDTGWVLAKQAPPTGVDLPPWWHVLKGDHPVPGQGSLESSTLLWDGLGSPSTNDLTVCLISGGGSALFCLPREGLPLEDIRETTALLLRAGANIAEINTVRKHLEINKGGGLARRLHPARVVTFLLSDVIDAGEDNIASGPTLPDPTTFDDALEVLERYGLLGAVPPGVVALLRSGEAGDIEETPKPGDGVFARTSALVIGSNAMAAEAAVAEARRRGFHSALGSTFLEGEASAVGLTLAALLKQMAQGEGLLPRPACVVFGGETTVTVRGQGKGGRNLELALGAVRKLAGVPGVRLVSFATDGEDGPTGAAGAVVSGETYVRGLAAGLDVRDFLARNDSYSYFEAMGGLVSSGPTGTNVNDLCLLITLPDGRNAR
jgi:hydroxypyruvate reductase